MPLRTRIVGTAVAGVALLTAASILTQPSGGPRWPTNRATPDQRLYVEMTLSWESGRYAEVTWRGAGVGPPEPERLDRVNGIPQRRKLGPYKRGDLFAVRLDALSHNGAALCGLRTVGKRQKLTAPQWKSSLDGLTTCSIVVGD